MSAHYKPKQDGSLVCRPETKNSRLQCIRTEQRANSETVVEGTRIPHNKADHPKFPEESACHRNHPQKVWTGSCECERKLVNMATAVLIVMLIVSPPLIVVFLHMFLSLILYTTLVYVKIFFFVVPVIRFRPVKNHIAYKWRRATFRSVVA